MSVRAEQTPRGLVAAALALTLVVLGLGAAILVLKLRPAELPASATERTVEIWRQRVAAAPEDFRPLVGLGLALLNAGRPEEARAVFEDVLELNPDSWVALTELGILLRDSDPTRAIGLLKDGAENAPPGSKAPALVMLGDLYLARGEHQAAAAAYRRALEDTPGVVDAYVGLARALEALGKARQALESYEQAARFDPANPEIAAAIERLRGRSTNGT
jgi:tetratricopeptide (TPR) repeat protein